MDPLIAEVAVPSPVRQTFSYRVPDALRASMTPGVRVRVPFGPRRVVGVCVGLRAEDAGERAEREAPAVPSPAPQGELFGGAAAGAVAVRVRGGAHANQPESAPRRALREIERVIDHEPAVTPALLELTRFVADYYRCSWGEAIQAALPGSMKRRIRKGGSERTRAVATASADPSPRADASPPPSTSTSTKRSRKGGSTSEPIATDTPVPVSPTTPTPALATTASPTTPPPTLTHEQQAALDVILPPLRARAFGVALLHGVTGSGKTEVYLRAIEESLSLGRGAILLVPEISLTPQTVSRVRARFGEVGLLHSMQTDAERGRHWELIRSGKLRVAVGPRSAVFAPVVNLGLIVVDEEHDGSFKQDSVPRYNARDLAIVRARNESAVVILGSATPSLETYVNAKDGRYLGAYLSERATRASLPSVEVVDLRDEVKSVKSFPFISRRLETVLKAALDRGEQAILFLNRRGFSTFLQCRQCNSVLSCAECDVALTFHKTEKLAVCHYCESQRPPPSECPKCLAPGVHYFGFGTERIEEEVLRRFPGTRVRRVDSDAIDDAADLEDVLASFGRGEIQVLIGTQMVAKGLDFARVTVVGVISADTALNLPDFRAAERTFQLVAQVTGRAGRADLGGISIVQTFCPDHPAIHAARTHDSLGFLETELVHRRRLGYPPFTKLARLVVSGPDETETARTAETIAGAMRISCDLKERGLVLLGPAPAPISVLRGKYRFMILVKARDRAALRLVLDEAERIKVPGRMRLVVDVDPTAML